MTTILFSKYTRNFGENFKNVEKIEPILVFTVENLIKHEKILEN